MKPAGSRLLPVPVSRTSRMAVAAAVLVAAWAAGASHSPLAAGGKADPSLPPAAAGVAAGPVVPQSAQPEQPSLVPRFDRGANPIALTGPARPPRYMEASGRRAAFLGREDGSFEAWAYPLKILHDLTLSFGVAAYADPIPAASLASWVDIRPESATVRYAHALFTVDATWLVPLDQPGGLVLLDVHASEPITVVVKFRIDLKPMWPAALGGQYSYWDAAQKAYVAGEGSGKHGALVGSPLALDAPEQPAHNLPDAPSQFSIRITPEQAAGGLVPIAIVASTDGVKGARTAYATLLGSVERAYRESEAHYRALRETRTSVETPDPRIGLALEWGKVALDKGFVCNPHLGCGLIAGLGPSGRTERPGFGWFFGGDAFINSWAMTAYGDFETVKRSFEFLRQRQRADGKMMHEWSQGSHYLRWAEDYPYGYYHADTTPLYIIAVRDLAAASGDLALVREFWPSVRKAYDYCTTTDEDGDGLMDNTRAGLAAVETGRLRSRDVLTDVFLGAVWTEAADAAADLAAVADPAFVPTARAAAANARASLNRRFLDDEARRIHFAVMKNGQGQSELTVWPAFGIWRGVFDERRPAVQGMLDELAGPGVGADWGARMLSRESALYEPLSYNNGAVWPFLTEFAALALYRNHRAPAAWAYLDGTTDLTFLEARGYMAELFSGDRLRSLDAAVPHQLFATTGYVSTLLRGLVGLGAATPAPGDAVAAAQTAAAAGSRTGSPGGTTPRPSDTSPDPLAPRLRVAPQLPAGWRFLRVRNLHWRDAVADLVLERTAQGLSVQVTPRRGSIPLDLELTLPPGAEPLPTAGARKATPLGGDASRGVRLVVSGTFESPETIRLPFRGGIEVAVLHDPLRLGDESRRLRIIDATLDRGVYTIGVQGRSGGRYHLRLESAFRVATLEGAVDTGADGTGRRLEVSFPPADRPWTERAIVVKLGARTAVR